MNITINVVGQKLTTNYTQIVEGSQNFVKFTFNLPTEWKEINPSACFSQEGKEPIGKLLEADTDGQTFFTYLPPEITEGKCELSLFGANNSEDGDVIGTSNCLTLTIDKKGSVDNIIESVPTPSIYKEWMDKIRDDTTSTINDAIAKAIADNTAKMQTAIKEAETAATTATNAAKEATDSATVITDNTAAIVEQASQAVEDANTAINNINSVYEQANQAVEDANTAIELAREAEGSIDRTVNNAVSEIKAFKNILVVNKLPEDAKNGDLCLYSAPNSIEAPDSGRRMYIDWNAITEYGASLLNNEEFVNSPSTSDFHLYNNEGDYIHISYGYDNDDSSVNIYVSCNFGLRTDYQSGHEYYTELSVWIKGLVNESDSVEFVLYDGNNSNFYVKHYPDTEEAVSIWNYTEENINTLPTSFDLGLWGAGEYIEISSDISQDVGLIYSPYRLMVYRDGWTRLFDPSGIPGYNV